MESTLKLSDGREVVFTTVKNDKNGNWRVVCHFLDIKLERKYDELDKHYADALKKARRFGGRKFHNKQYGGGIVFNLAATNLDYLQPLFE